MRITPTIFIPNSSNNDLIEVLIEEYPDFDILWYHWPKDGNYLKYRIVQEEDYEPVILIYDESGKLCELITRRHWHYQDYLPVELVKPIEIIFDGEDHPPYPKTHQNAAWFEAEKARLVARRYVSKSIVRNQVAKKFRTGKGHGANPVYVQIVKDPFVQATREHKNKCLK